jgi:hypothetical protein
MKYSPSYKADSTQPVKKFAVLYGTRIFTKVSTRYRYCVLSCVTWNEFIPSNLISLGYILNIVLFCDICFKMSTLYSMFSEQRNREANVCVRGRPDLPGRELASAVWVLDLKNKPHCINFYTILLRGFGPLANCADRATAASWRSSTNFCG